MTKKPTNSKASKPAATKTSSAKAKTAKPSATKPSATKRSEAAKKPLVIEGEAKTSAKPSAAEKPAAEIKKEATSTSKATPAKAAETKSDKKPEDKPTGKTAEPKKAEPKKPAVKKSRGGGLIGGIIGGSLVAGAGYYALDKGYLPQLTDEAGKIEAVAAADEAASKIAEQSEMIAALEGRLAGLEAANSAPKDFAATSDIDSLNAQFDELRGLIESGAGGEGPALETIAASMEELRTNVETATSDEALSALVATEFSDLENQISSMSETLKEISTASGDNAAALDSVKQELSVQAEDQQKAQTALATASLNAAVNSGQPFAGQLAALISSNPAAEADVADLLPFADGGLPKPEAFLAEFDTVAASALEAMKPKVEGTANRFMASIKSLVTVRPAGEVEGDTPAAIISRMRGAIEQTDYDRYASELGALPSAGQEAFSGFTDQIDLRQKANAALAASTASQGEAQ